jgi:pilus assembly protein CpaB
MMFRRILLLLGGLALVAGLALFVLWLKAPGGTVVAETPVVPPQAILAAARILPAGTLLRADDLRWVQAATADIPPDSFVRGQATETDLLGAATKREFHSGEALVADQLIKPTDPGFLPAVLAPGMRATSIAVDPAEGGAGLITPGDRVDVILTQSFTDATLNLSHRSVGETILPNLRVIAIDQTTKVVGTPLPGAVRAPAAALEPHLPKTVTLEVTVHQAEVLMVAGQLGKLQLTLRSLADATRPASLTPEEPTWASEVSPALRSLAPGPAASPVLRNGRAQGAPLGIEIIRGSKSEVVCYSSTTGSSADCTGTSGEAAPALPAATPGGPHPERPKS